MDNQLINIKKTFYITIFIICFTIIVTSVTTSLITSYFIGNNIYNQYNTNSINLNNIKTSNKLYDSLLSYNILKANSINGKNYNINIKNSFVINEFNSTKIKSIILVTDYCTIITTKDTKNNNSTDIQLKSKTNKKNITSSNFKMDIHPLPGFENSILPKLVYNIFKKYDNVEYIYTIKHINYL